MRNKILLWAFFFLLGANLGIAYTVHFYEKKIDSMKKRQLMDPSQSVKNQEPSELEDEELMPPEEIKIYKL